MFFLKNIFRKKETNTYKNQIEEESLFQNNCRHGDYKHQILFGCCNKYYDCSLCHKENCDFYLLDTPSILKIRCIDCGTTQSTSIQCQNSECRVKFAEDFCKKCCVWSSKGNKSYHCHKCNICYIQIKDKLIHCDTCNSCYYPKTFKNHKCSMNPSENKCQICFMKLKETPYDSTLLDCGHSIHDHCLLEYYNSCKKENKLVTCCFCRKSIEIYKEEMEKKIDNLVNNWLVSGEKKNWLSNISCIDCEQKSVVRYHPKYRKCLICKSYNNYEINIIKDNDINQEICSNIQIIPSAPPLIQ